jgi:Cys-tRNA(Pro)/Cys-tRNA(Cys) deacylase
MAKKMNAMRILEGAGVPYEVIEFPAEVHDAAGVAEHAGEPPECVYKTLVVIRDQGKPMLVMVAADRTLSLKKLGKAVGAKRLRMAKHAEAEKLTGLQVGGIGALSALHKGFDVFIDRPALDLPHILVSPGKRGLNLRLPVEGLIEVTGAQVVEATDQPEA